MEEPTTTTLPGVRIAGGVSRWRRPHFALKIAFSLLTGTKFAEMRDICVAFGSFVLGHERFFAAPPAYLRGVDDRSLRPFGRARQ